MAELASRLYLALVHYPVVNRNQEIVTSSVTNLDLHDIARAGRTFGVGGYFVVHPSSDQQALNRRILRHWGGSFGKQANRTRMEALDLIELVGSIEEAVESIGKKESQKPFLVGTSAKPQAGKALNIEGLREKLNEAPVLLVFGTAYGLSAEWNERLEGFLPPIQASSDFNHLSVRSAATIYLDRLFGS